MNVVFGWRASRRSRAAISSLNDGKSLPWNDQSGCSFSSSKRSLKRSMGRKNASGSAMWMETGSSSAAQASHIGSKRLSSIVDERAGADLLPQVEAQRLQDLDALRACGLGTAQLVGLPFRVARLREVIPRRLGEHHEAIRVRRLPRLSPPARARCRGCPSGSPSCGCCPDPSRTAHPPGAAVRLTASPTGTPFCVLRREAEVRAHVDDWELRPRRPR